MAFVNPDTTYTRAFKRALALAGSEAALAQALGTSAELLRKWLSGQLQPPTKLYLAALDFVAQESKRG